MEWEALGAKEARRVLLMWDTRTVAKIASYTRMYTISCMVIPHLENPQRSNFFLLTKNEWFSNRVTSFGNSNSAKPLLKLTTNK